MLKSNTLLISLFALLKYIKKAVLQMSSSSIYQRFTTNHLLDLHHQRVSSFSFIDFFLKHILYLIYFFSSYSIRSFWGEKNERKKKDNLFNQPQRKQWIFPLNRSTILSVWTYSKARRHNCRQSTDLTRLCKHKNTFRKKPLKNSTRT